MNIEYLLSLGLTPQEAASIYKTQNYQPPEDLDKAREHAHQWSNYDKEMGALTQDLALGRITPEEFSIKETELYDKAQKGKL